MPAAGAKALQGAMQMCQDAKQALCMYQLHVVCPTGDVCVGIAASRYSKAVRELDAHVCMALENGKSSDLGEWASLAVQVKSMHFLVERATHLWEASRGQVKGKRPMQLLADPPSPMLLQVAAATQLSAATTQQPPSAVSPADRNVAEATVAATAGTSATPSSEAPPADTISWYTGTRGPLASLGLPGRLFWTVPYTPSAPMYSPYNLEASESPYGKGDPNLILWDPDCDNLKWIDVDRHLNPACMSNMAGVFASAQVLIETDNQEHGQPADPLFQQSLLKNLDPENLPAFALAALIDIMIMAVVDNFVELSDELLQGGAAARAEAGVWSRRLVYCRRLDQDCLLGCIQVLCWPAQQGMFSLLAMMASDRLRLKGPEASAERVEAQGRAGILVGFGGPEDHQRPLAIKQGPIPSRCMTGRKHRCLFWDGDEWALRNSTPEEEDMASKSACEHAPDKRMTQHEARPAPEPAKRPAAVKNTRSRLQADDTELAKKLMEAQEALAARYDSSKRQRGEKWDSGLLEREKLDDRHRRAWAKVGKKPPAPKASKPSATADGLDHPPPHTPSKPDSENPNSSIKPLFPSHSSSNATPTQPASGRSGSSSKSPTQPPATSAPNAARRLSYAAAASSHAAQPAAAGAAVSSGSTGGVPSAAAESPAAAAEDAPAAEPVADASTSPASSGEQSPSANAPSEAGSAASDHNTRTGTAAGDGAHGQAEPGQQSPPPAPQSEEPEETGHDYPSYEDVARLSDCNEDGGEGDGDAAVRGPADASPIAKALRLRRAQADAEEKQQLAQQLEADLVRRREAEAEAIANADALLR